MVGIPDLGRGDVTVATVIELLGIDVKRVSGSLQTKLESVCPLSAVTPGALSFCRRSDARLDAAARSSAAAIIVPAERPIDAFAGGPTLIAVENPRLAFMRVAARLFDRKAPVGIHATAVIHPASRIDPTASIGPLVTVGANCEVGARSVLHSGVCLYPNSRIGADVILHAGVVVGADGFGFERDSSGALVKFPHLGGVVVGDDVEIGANSCVDRGTLGDTIIERGAKLDNLVHVAHNCVVGQGSLLTAQTMLAGSVTVGPRVWLSPGCRILNNTTIGSGATVGMGANVMSDVAPGATVVAPPARTPMGGARR